MLPGYICMKKIIILWSDCESWGGKCPSSPPYSASPVRCLHYIGVLLHATPYRDMCISIFQQITKMYDMLNKNSQGLLKKGTAKQSRIKSIVKL